MASITPVPLSFVCAQPEGKCTNEPPIIFMHGITASKLDWTDIPQRVANATKRKAYVVDSRNHGDSEWSDESNCDVNVADLLHFMDYIRAPRAVLVGHSMGGNTAIQTALRAPERVERIVVEDMYTKKVTQDVLDAELLFITHTKKALEHVPDDADEHTAKRIMQEYMVKVSTYEPPNRKTEKMVDAQAIFHLKRSQLGDRRFRHSANYAVLERAMADCDFLVSENRGEYTGPAAFIYGQMSFFSIGKETDNIKEHFPNAEFYEIKNAGHSIHEEFPDAFVKNLMKFLMK